MNGWNERKEPPQKKNNYSTLVGTTSFLLRIIGNINIIKKY
jgi:hypothetical protein